MRLCLLFVGFILLFLPLNADLIATKKDNLEEKNRIAKQLNKKLEDLADDILKGQKKLNSLSKQINNIEDKSKDTKEKARQNAKELELLSHENKDMLNDKNKMEGKLINLIAKDFAYDLALPSESFISKESVIVGEVISKLDLILKDEFARLSRNYSRLNLLIENKQKKINSLNTGLKRYEARLNKLRLLKNDQEKELLQQKNNKAIYAQKIKDIERQQRQLRQTLEKLAIIKQRQNQAKNQNEPKMIGSGYGVGKVKNYKGPKTIAPLNNFTIKQAFGKFIDPIYKIKIFNENVILRSKEENALVKSVLAGKVVFAKQTPILQNVVIIEHAKGIHTIYAHLERIAPTIKAGRNIRKGYIIGRVKRDLTFEVTQQNYHINPMQLIR